MYSKRRSHRALGAMVLAASLLAAACGGSDSDSSSETTTTSGADSESVLGKKNPAKGEPVKVGTVYDGQTPAFDNTDQLRVAEAMVEYINDHRGGLAGRPIELVSCETGGDQAKSVDCANELISQDVVLTVLPAIATTATVWKSLNEAGVPTWIYSATDADVQKDEKSTFLTGSPKGTLIDLPAKMAKDNDLKKVVAVVIDVPAATQIYKDTKTSDGVSFELVAIPPGQADMTPQMAKIANEGDVAVQIVGNDTFAISAMKGLQAAAFDGPISCIGCDTEAARKALGNTLDGVLVAVQGRTNPGDEDADLWHAIASTYAKDVKNPDEMIPVSAYTVWAAARDSLDGLEGDVTRATVLDAIQTMPSTHLRMFLGAQFRCNGKASPDSPASCANAVVYTTLDDAGQPGKISVSNTDPIPD